MKEENRKERIRNFCVLCKSPRKLIHDDRQDKQPYLNIPTQKKYQSNSIILYIPYVGKTISFEFMNYQLSTESTYFRGLCL